MKKITFFLAAILMASMGFSQSANSIGFSYANNINAKLNKQQDVKFFSGAAIQQQLNSRAPGDIITSYDFNATIPTGWTTTDNTGNGFTFIWSDIGPTGAYTHVTGQSWDTPISPLASTTSSNGFLMFPADYYNTDPNTGVIVSNIVTHDSYIQTEALDFSSYTNVILQFQERFRLCCTFSNADLYVEVSNDGTNWTSYPVASPYAAINDHSCPSDTITLVEVNISPEAAGQSNVFVRFHINGLSHYYWMLDDVNFIEGPTDDVIMTNLYDYFFSIDNGRYPMVPLLQSRYQPIFFRGEIYNNGSNAATNVSMSADVLHDGNAYYSETSDVLGNFAFLADSALKAGYDGTNLTNPLYANNIGNYDETWTVSFDNTDQYPVNNTVTRSFEVTDSVYARDGGVWTGSVSVQNWVGGGNDGDAIGISFDINNDSTTQIAENQVNSISFFLDPRTFRDTSVGPTVKGEIKMYDGTAFVSVIETDIYDVQQADTGTWVTLPFLQDGFTEKLATGWYIGYMDVVGYNGGDFYVGEDAETFQQNIATFWTLGDGSATDNYFSNYSKAPMIRVNFEPYPLVGIGNNNSVNSLIVIYPNPANTQLHVDNVEGATISVYNLVGEKVSELTNANKFNTLNTANLAAGTYIVKVVNNNQVTTKKINIVK